MLTDFQPLGVRSSDRATSFAVFDLERGTTIGFTRDLVDSDVDLPSLKQLRAFAYGVTLANPPSAYALGRGIHVELISLSSRAGTLVAVSVNRVHRNDPVAAARERFNLSPRETDVLEHLLVGKTTAEIARTLVIAESTVGDHVGAILRKTGVSRRPQLLALVLAGNRPAGAAV